MILRKRKKKETLGRLFVFGDFFSNKPLPTSGEDRDKANTPPKCEQEAAKITVVQDAGKKTLNGTAKTPREMADRQAIERGEDEGMMVGRE